MKDIKVNKTVAGIFVLLILMVGFLGASFMSTSGFSFGAQSVVPVDGGVTVAPDVSKECDIGTADAVVFQVLSLTPDGAVTDVTVDYNFEVRSESATGTVAGTTQNSTSVSLGKLKSYNVHLYGDDATHGAYYANHSFATGCEASEVVVISKGAEDTAITTAVYALAGSVETANTATATTAIGAGGTAKGRFYVTATTANGAWSTANGGRKALVTFDYNALVYKQPQIIGVSSGVASGPMSAPTNVADVVSSSTQQVSFEITTDALIDLGDLEVDWLAETRSASTNPTGVDGNIGMTLSDKEGFRADDLQWYVAYEDTDAGTDIGEDDSTDTFHVA